MDCTHFDICHRKNCDSMPKSGSIVAAPSRPVGTSRSCQAVKREPEYPTADEKCLTRKTLMVVPGAWGKFARGICRTKQLNHAG